VAFLQAQVTSGSGALRARSCRRWPNVRPKLDKLLTDGRLDLQLARADAHILGFWQSMAARLRTGLTD
jgi:hypothetical protein